MSFPCIADVNMLATLLAVADPCDPWQIHWPNVETLGEDVMDGALQALMGNPKPKRTPGTIWDEPAQFRMNFYELDAFAPTQSITSAGF
jgi:hypothetical protein